MSFLMDRVFRAGARRSRPGPGTVHRHAAQAAATLLAGLLLTLAGWHVGRAYVEREFQAARREQAEEMRRVLARRILVSTEGLRGLQSLFAASESVTREEFRRFVEGLRVAGQHGDVQAFEFIRYVPAAGRSDFEAQVRADASLDPRGLPPFPVHPGGDRPFYLVVDFVEPFEGNERARGFDLATEESRLRAALLARDTGEPQATAPVRLVQEAGTQAGFLYFLPVYSGQASGGPVAGRRGAFQGLVCAVFRAGDMVREVFGPGLCSSCDYDLVDVGPAGPDRVGPAPAGAVLYSSRNAPSASRGRPAGEMPEVEPIQVGGRNWRLVFRHVPVELTGAILAMPPAILAGGTMISLLAAALVFSTGARRGAADRARGLALDLAHSTEELRILTCIFAESAEGILVTDRNGLIVEVNDAWCRITGYSRHEVLGRNPRLLKSQWHEVETYERMWEALNREGHWQGEIWDRRRDGSLYAVNCAIRVVSDADGRVTHYVGIQHDITEYLQHNQRATFLATHDALTGLPNRTLLMDRLEQAFRDADRLRGSVTVAYLDLDGFKSVNDEMGHLAGDKVLQEISRRLTSCVRGHDTVARLGGDEYVMVLPGDRGTFLALAPKLSEAIAAPMVILGRELNVTASLGAAVYPDDARETETLLKCADTAMFQAKRGRPGSYRLFGSGGDSPGAGGVRPGLRRAVERS